MSVPASGKDKITAIVAAASQPDQVTPLDVILADLKKTLSEKNDAIEYLDTLANFIGQHSKDDKLIAAANALIEQKVKELLDRIVHFINTETNNYKIYLAVSEFKAKYRPYSQFNIVEKFYGMINSNGPLHDKISAMDALYNKLEVEIESVKEAIQEIRGHIVNRKLNAPTNVNQFLLAAISHCDTYEDAYDFLEKTNHLKRLLRLPAHVLSVLLEFNIESCQFHANEEAKTFRDSPLLQLYKEIDNEACVLLLNADPEARFDWKEKGTRYLLWAIWILSENRSETRQLRFFDRAIGFINLLLARGLNPRHLNLIMLRDVFHPFQFLQPPSQDYMSPEIINFYKFIVSSFEIDYKLYPEMTSGVPLHHYPRFVLDFAVNRFTLQFEMDKAIALQQGNSFGSP